VKAPAAEPPRGTWDSSRGDYIRRPRFASRALRQIGRKFPSVWPVFEFIGEELIPRTWQTRPMTDDEISRNVGLCSRSVARAVAELVRQGLLTARRGTHRGQASVYLIPTLAEYQAQREKARHTCQALKGSEPDTHVRHSGEKARHRRARKPDTGVTPLKNKKEEEKTTTTKPPPQLDARNPKRATRAGGGGGDSPVLTEAQSQALEQLLEIGARWRPKCEEIVREHPQLTASIILVEWRMHRDAGGQQGSFLEILLEDGARIIRDAHRRAAGAKPGAAAGDELLDKLSGEAARPYLEQVAQRDSRKAGWVDQKLALDSEGRAYWLRDSITRQDVLDLAKQNGHARALASTEAAR
jgi:hypothetical protein